jgi:hypothetical protein
MQGDRDDRQRGHERRAEERGAAAARPTCLRTGSSGGRSSRARRRRDQNPPRGRARQLETREWGHPRSSGAGSRLIPARSASSRLGDEQDNGPAGRSTRAVSRRTVCGSDVLEDWIASTVSTRVRAASSARPRGRPRRGSSTEECAPRRLEGRPALEGIPRSRREKKSKPPTSSTRPRAWQAARSRYPRAPVARGVEKPEERGLPGGHHEESQPWCQSSRAELRNPMFS